MSGHPATSQVTRKGFLGSRVSRLAFEVSRIHSVSKTHHTNLGDIFVTKEKLAGKFFSATYFYLKYVCLRYCTCFDELVSTFGRGNTQDIQMSAQIGCWSHHVLPKWSAELTHCRLRFDSSKKSKKCPCFVKHPLLGGIAVQLCVLIPIPIRFAGAKSCPIRKSLKKCSRVPK